MFAHHYSASYIGIDSTRLCASPAGKPRPCDLCPVEKNAFKIGGIEFFKEAAIRNGFAYDTKVVKLEKVIANKKIAERSCFRIGDELNKLRMKIMTSKRKMPTELATAEDKKYLELGDYNCLAIVSGRVFNELGIQFEYTESRHRPDYFCFEDTATRHKFKG